MTSSTRVRYRSKYEATIAADLSRREIRFMFESDKITYLKDASTYLTDFRLVKKDGTYLFVEAKGLFKACDRTKHLLIKEQHPDLDIRFLFMQSKNTLSKTSKTTYAAWCDKYSFIYADGRVVPNFWLN